MNWQWISNTVKNNIIIYYEIIEIKEIKLELLFVIKTLGQYINYNLKIRINYSCIIKLISRTTEIRYVFY